MHTIGEAFTTHDSSVIPEGLEEGEVVMTGRTNVDARAQDIHRRLPPFFEAVIADNF
jgi:hypothetical protein